MTFSHFSKDLIRPLSQGDSLSGERGGCRDAACSVRGLRPACPLIHHSAIGFVGGLGGHNVGTGAKAGVGEAHFLQPAQVFLVDVATLALPYGFAIPGEAQPLQVVHQLEGILPAAALRVEVLDAQNPLAPLALGGKPGEEGTEYIAQVHASGRGGSKSASCHATKVRLFSQIPTICTFRSAKAMAIRIIMCTFGAQNDTTT